MIWLLLILVAICYLISDNEEHNAMCWVGEKEFNNAKKTMTSSQFKKYVKENSAKMRKAMNDSARKYYEDKK